MLDLGVSHSTGHTEGLQETLFQAPGRFDALFVTNVSLNQTPTLSIGLQTSSHLGRIWKMVVSHAADTVSTLISTNDNSYRHSASEPTWATSSPISSVLHGHSSVNIPVPNRSSTDSMLLSNLFSLGKHSNGCPCCKSSGPNTTNMKYQAEAELVMALYSTPFLLIVRRCKISSLYKQYCSVLKNKGEMSFYAEKQRPLCSWPKWPLRKRRKKRFFNSRARGKKRRNRNNVQYRQAAVNNQGGHCCTS